METESGGEFRNDNILKRGKAPKPKIIRHGKTKAGERTTIEKSVGLQPELLSTNGQPIEVVSIVEGRSQRRDLTGTIVPTVDGRRLKSIEKAAAEQQANIEPDAETLRKAKIQSNTIRSKIQKRK